MTYFMSTEISTFEEAVHMSSNNEEAKDYWHDLDLLITLHKLIT
jgi:hypothetical protein